MADKKTRKDYFEEIKAMIMEDYQEEDQDLVAFVDGEIAKIDNRAAKEKEKRAEKRAQGDELTAQVKEYIVNAGKAVTGQEIADAIGGDVTKAKVVYRAGQLVKAGEIFKTKVDKVVAYTAEAPADAEVEAE